MGHPAPGVLKHISIKLYVGSSCLHRVYYIAWNEAYREENYDSYSE
ncbi:unnamed protein product, partial [marine sediment metagenome]